LRGDLPFTQMFH